MDQLVANIMLLVCLFCAWLLVPVAAAVYYEMYVNFNIAKEPASQMTSKIFAKFTTHAAVVIKCLSYTSSLQN
jgi:hypothetical protein